MFSLGKPTPRGAMRVAPGRGRVTGVLIALIGLWAVLVPLVGPYVTDGPDLAGSWTMSWAVFWVVLAPGLVLAASGSVLFATGQRVTGAAAAVIAAAAGAWLAVGPALTATRVGYAEPAITSVAAGGLPGAGQIPVSTVLGAAVLLLSGLALGRFTVRGTRDVAAAEAEHQRREEASAERERGDAEANGQDPHRVR